MSDLVYPATPKAYRTIPVSSAFPVEVFRTESGRQQRVIHGDGAEEIGWQLQYPMLSGADAATLQAFHRAHAGDTFLYDSLEPAGVVRRRVAISSFNLQHEFKTATDRRWSLTVTLEVVP